GVHYPSDVIAGALLGCGNGVSFVVGTEMLWQFIGSRWLPLWYQRFPGWVTAPDRTFSAALPASRVTPDVYWLRLGYGFIAVMLVTRLIYLASDIIELTEDEAYQWLWSKHLAFSYFSKPPLIAWTQWLGTHLCGDTALGVRFFAPLLAAGGSVLVLRFFAKHVSSRAGFWLVVLASVTPLLATGSILMTVDALLVFFWTLAMISGWRAVQANGTVLDWILTGVCTGLAFLSKYTALLQLVCWAVFFILSRPARIHLRRAGPYLALLSVLVCALPVIFWNAQHGWVTASHVATDAKLDEPWHFKPANTFVFLFATAALLHPICFVAAVWAAIAFWKAHRDDPLLCYFFAMGVPVYLFYLVFTIHSRVLENWIAAAVIPAFCLMAVYWDRRFRAGARALRGWLWAA
ncbi:MAG TPA: glycosyltransferase family 39 protein, partial [Burkholderiales bacterium]|nr:glycosyltransferase family 39 protein [Burkholderiales bacterium]